MSWCLGDAEAEEDAREVAHAGLAEAGRAGDGAEVQHVVFREIEHLLQRAQVVLEGDAGLDDARIGEELGEHRVGFGAAQLEQVHGAPGSDLDERRQVALAFFECRPRLGVEADDGFLAQVGLRFFEFFRRGDEDHFALVAADGQLGQVLAGNRAGDVGAHEGVQGTRYTRVELTKRNPHAPQYPPRCADPSRGARQDRELPLRRRGRGPGRD